jgi:hypothetical protein
MPCGAVQESTHLHSKLYSAKNDRIHFKTHAVDIQLIYLAAFLSIWFTQAGVF